MTHRPIKAMNFRHFATSFTMYMLGREQPYGMPTSMMENLHMNPSTFANNVANSYSSPLASGSIIGNPG